MTDVTITTEEGAGETGAAPLTEAAAAVEVLESVREEGRAEGVAEGLVLASVADHSDRLTRIETALGELTDTLRAAAALGSAQSEAISELRARVFDAEVAIVEAPVVEVPAEVVTEETTGEVVTEEEATVEPVADRTPSRKRHYT